MVTFALRTENLRQRTNIKIKMTNNNENNSSETDEAGALLPRSL